MGFSGGGSNVTKAHTHSSSIVQDGGALNFDNVTQASLAAGDITYSDGSALQVLGIGSATDTLTVNAGATAPEWAAGGAGGGGKYEFIDSFTATASTTFDCTFTAVTATTVSEIVAVLNGTLGAGSCLMQVGGETGSGYSWNGWDSTGDGVLVGDYGSDIAGFTIMPTRTAAGSKVISLIHTNVNRSSDQYQALWQTSGTDVGSSAGSGFNSNSGKTSINGLKFTKSANNFATDVTCDIYKVTL